MVLSGVTALVLLVACVNFTNLMLARSEGRRREFVIRLALGAGRGRLVRQAATECILLALTAGVLGLLFSSWATTVVLRQFAILITPIELAAGPDGRVLSFVAGTIALVIAFGLWPSTRPALAAVVSSVRQSTSARRARRRSLAGRVILVAQLSMCAVILIVAGLFLLYRQQPAFAGARLRSKRAPRAAERRSGRLLGPGGGHAPAPGHRSAVGPTRHPRRRHFRSSAPRLHELLD